MSKFLFGFPYYLDKINPNNYNKKQIIDQIEYNYSIDSSRNIWDKNFIDGSNLHHSHSDWGNNNFLSINFEELKDQYSIIIEKFLSNLKFIQNINYYYSIVNYTCMRSSQHMRSHVHPDCDFSMIHYLKFDNDIHKPTIFYNPSSLSKFYETLFPNLHKKLDPSYPENSFLSESFYFNVNEDDICIVPGFLSHSVPFHNTTEESRITIVTNITIS